MIGGIQAMLPAGNAAFYGKVPRFGQGELVLPKLQPMEDLGLLTQVLLPAMSQIEQSETPEVEIIQLGGPGRDNIWVLVPGQGNIAQFETAIQTGGYPGHGLTWDGGKVKVFQQGDGGPTYDVTITTFAKATALVSQALVDRLNRDLL